MENRSVSTKKRKKTMRVFIPDCNILSCSQPKYALLPRAEGGGVFDQVGSSA